MSTIASKVDAILEQGNSQCQQLVDTVIRNNSLRVFDRFSSIDEDLFEEIPMQLRLTNNVEGMQQCLRYATKEISKSIATIPKDKIISLRRGGTHEEPQHQWMIKDDVANQPCAII